MGSSDGVYLISFSVGIASATLSTEQLIECCICRSSNRWFNFCGFKGSGASPIDSSSDKVGSVQLSGTFIYKSTTATTKIRLRAYANPVGTGTNTWAIGADVNDIIQGSPSAATNSRCTFLSIMRIA